MPISSVRTKGTLIEDHEIKIVNFAENTNIFLGEIICLNRIQVILKLYEKASSSKINFSEAKSYGLEHIKMELINHDKWNGLNFPIKILGVNFGNSILDNSNWNKLNKSIIKKSKS